MTHPAFPFDIGTGGQTALADTRSHLRQMIEQVLLTSTGERVMRPNFGAGLSAMVFEPTSGAIAATLETAAHAALQRWLGTRVEILGVSVQSNDSTLNVEVRFRDPSSGANETLSMELAP